MDDDPEIPCSSATSVKFNDLCAIREWVACGWDAKTLDDVDKQVGRAHAIAEADGEKLTLSLKLIGS
jgi:hypothetical protein